VTTVEATTRPGAAADAVAGVVPREVARPHDATEVAELLRSGAGSGTTVVPVGGRSKLGWCPPPRSCDLVLETTGLERIVEHTAGDLVVVAEAGVRRACRHETKPRPRPAR
jgi:glycolate oxidase FAD binding subunit